MDISNADNKLLKELGIEDIDSGEIEYFEPSSHINRDKLKEYNDVINPKSTPTEYEDTLDKDFFSIDNPSLLNNVIQFTRLKEEITGDPDYEEYNNYIEEIRLFPKNFLKDRGIFLSLDKQDTIDSYPYLRDSSLYQTTTDEAYRDRYMIPICLPDGKVVIHTGYRPSSFNIEGPKYETSFYDWMSQGSVIGNMESLGIYKKSRELYVVEGMFDAYRINQVLESPSVAMLGSILTKEKLTILSLLKEEGYSLILVPDQDEAGMEDRLLNHRLFDNIMYYGNPDEDKDFDLFCGKRYLETLEDLFGELSRNKSLFDLKEEEIKLSNENIKRELRYKIRPETITDNSFDIFQFL